jgi:hypothetical protein
MPILRTGLTVAAAALLASAAAVAATQSSGSAATVAATRPVPAADNGIAVMKSSFVDLPPAVWTNTSLEVKLPRSGTYELDANVRGRLQGTPPLNTYITARLWNVTSGTQVPLSERLVYQVINYNTGNAPAGDNQTAPISELIEVTRPTTIRLQAQDNNNNGAASIAQIFSDEYGYTSLRFERVGS